VELIKEGRENLISSSGAEEKRNLAAVMDILQKLDINSRRIFFWP